MTTLLKEREAEFFASTNPKPLPRWLHVLSHTDPKYGGLSSAVPALARELWQSSLSRTALAAFCAKDEQVLPDAFSPSQVTYWPDSKSTWLLDTFNKGKLHARLTDLFSGFDGVHIHGLWEQSTLAAVSAARSVHLPYVLSAHGMLEPWALANKRLKKLLYTKLVERQNVAGASCLHALTRAEADQYIRFGAKSPIVVIPNGVKVPEIVDPSLFGEQYPEIRGKRIVLFLARLHPKKGLDLLLESWSNLAASFPDAHLVVAGPDQDGMLERLRAVVSTRNLQRSVLFAGMLAGEMKWSALATAEIFVLPSHSEGLSIAALEALGVGLPVIVTHHCNMPEVTNFDAGWEIQATVRDLTLALEEALRNGPASNREMGLRGAQLVKQRYTWSSVSARMAEVYRWIGGGPSPQQVDVIYPGASS